MWWAVVSAVNPGSFQPGPPVWWSHGQQLPQPRTLRTKADTARLRGCFRNFGNSSHIRTRNATTGFSAAGCGLPLLTACAACGRFARQSLHHAVAPSNGGGALWWGCGNGCWMQCLHCHQQDAACAHGVFITHVLVQLLPFWDSLFHVHGRSFFS